MKNIHVLPTDKPSRLFYNVGGALLFTNYENHNGVNIYITSDEEIKEGTWFYSPATKAILYASNEMLAWNCDTTQKHKGWKKIILTTDQDLIKDGVQAINDEFLEWFVKNLSCEKVDVDKAEHGMYKDDVYYILSNKIFYKIIIPKEEPKQETLEEVELSARKLSYDERKKLFIDKLLKEKRGIKGSSNIEQMLQWFDEENIPKEESKQECIVTKSMQMDAEMAYDSLPKQDLRKYPLTTDECFKQETLEEAAERLFGNDDDGMYLEKRAFIKGAKWQQERMYSEEEVKKIIKLSCEQGMLIQRTINDKVKIPYTRIEDFTIKMFEQFKKK